MKRAFSRLRFGIFTRSHFYGINRPRVNHVTPAKMVMAILLCALVLRTPAAVYQQLPGQFGGFSSDGSTITVADDFQLGQDTLIGSIGWWGGYFDPAPGLTISPSGFLRMTAVNLDYSWTSSISARSMPLRPGSLSMRPTFIRSTSTVPVCRLRSWPRQASSTGSASSILRETYGYGRRRPVRSIRMCNAASTAVHGNRIMIIRRLNLRPFRSHLCADSFFWGRAQRFYFCAGDQASADLKGRSELLHPLHV